MSSNRLPGKVLRPIAGFPAVVLAARRAARTGLPLIVATSTDPSDDPLVAALDQAQIPSIRGPLDDVLSRFLIATSDLAATDTVVRLTADNVIPDGEYIAALLSQLQREQLDYLGPDYPRDGMPHGVSVEAMLVSALREADRYTVRAEDREHVTTILRRRGERTPYRPEWAGGSRAHLCGTIDTLPDYRRVACLMSGVEHPIEASVEALCARLEIQERLMLRVSRQSDAELDQAIARGVVWFMAITDDAEGIERLKLLATRRADRVKTALIFDRHELSPRLWCTEEPVDDATAITLTSAPSPKRTVSRALQVASHAETIRLARAIPELTWLVVDDFAAAEPGFTRPPADAAELAAARGSAITAGWP
jgi:spore coat polysaccharide biosynthesis protein SpsF (cytidylyltransferase family)